MGLQVDLDVCYLIEPFGTTAGRTIPHTGDDWARRRVDGKVIAEAPEVRAVFSGTVEFSAWHAVAGNRIIIRYWHGLYGDYGHLKSLGVKPGQAVKEGQYLGELGGTGNVTGPHLHYTQSTDLGRLLKGIYPYWKDPKTGRLLWPSVDSWAAASGLTRPSYSRDVKASDEEKFEEIIMSFTPEEKNEVLALLRSIRAEQLDEDGVAQATQRHAAAAAAAAVEVRDGLFRPGVGESYTAMQHFRQSLNAIRAHLGI